MGSFPHFAQILGKHRREDFSSLLISEAIVFCWIVHIFDEFLSIGSIEDELSNGSVMASSRPEFDDAPVASGRLELDDAVVAVMVNCSESCWRSSSCLESLEVL